MLGDAAGKGILHKRVKSLVFCIEFLIDQDGQTLCKVIRFHGMRAFVTICDRCSSLIFVQINPPPGYKVRYYQQRTTFQITRWTTLSPRKLY